MKDTAWFLLILGASLITSADAWTIQKSAEMISTVLFVYLVFKERPTLVIILSVIMCIIGTIMVSKAGFIFGGQSLNALGVILALLCGVTSSSTMVSTQYLKGVHSKFALAYSRMLLSAVLYLVIPSVYFMIYPHRWLDVSDNPKALSLWILAGLIYSCSLPLSTMANVVIGAQALSIVAQSVIFWSALIEIIIFNEHESIVQYCGMLIVCLAIILKPVYEIYLHHSLQPEQDTIDYDPTAYVELSEDPFVAV